MKKIVAICAIVLGIIFLIVSKSDIQLGSGAILIAVGILNFPAKEIKK